MKILDYQAVLEDRPGAYITSDHHEKEVYFPRVADITFPVGNARDGALKRGIDFAAEIASGRHEVKEMSLEEKPVATIVDKDPGTSDKKPRNERITFNRLLEL